MRRALGLAAIFAAVRFERLEACAVLAADDCPLDFRKLVTCENSGLLENALAVL